MVAPEDEASLSNADPVLMMVSSVDSCAEVRPGWAILMLTLMVSYAGALW